MHGWTCGNGQHYSLVGSTAVMPLCKHFAGSKNTVFGVMMIHQGRCDRLCYGYRRASLSSLPRLLFPALPNTLGLLQTLGALDAVTSICHVGEMTAFTCLLFDHSDACEPLTTFSFVNFSFLPSKIEVCLSGPTLILFHSKCLPWVISNTEL